MLKEKCKGTWSKVIYMVLVKIAL